MVRGFRVALCVLCVTLLASCAAPLAVHQIQPSTVVESELKDKAIVIFAVDLRELTSLHDLPQVEDIYFRRVGEQYASQANSDYDFGIEEVAAADWRANFRDADESKAPHMFAVAPGTYVIEKINIGSGSTTAGPGYDVRASRANFGTFSVDVGEVVNLGRLIVRMRCDERYFYAQTDDNSDEVRRFLAERNPVFEPKLQTRLLAVEPKFKFQTSGGRF